VRYFRAENLPLVHLFKTLGIRNLRIGGNGIQKPLGEDDDADHRASGINFHTGDKVAAGEESAPCRYAAYLSVPGGYEVHPVGYAIKTFDLGGHGTLIAPSRLVSRFACEPIPTAQCVSVAGTRVTAARTGLQYTTRVSGLLLARSRW
jgi:hypothetical protein